MVGRPWVDGAVVAAVGTNPWAEYQAWERWFSREQAFQTVVTWCLQIMETSQNQWPFQRYRPIFQLARPHFFRHVVLRAVKNRLLLR